MAEVPGYGDKGRKHRMQMLQEMHDETPGYLPAFVNAIASRVSPLHRKKPFMLATYLGNLYENSYNALHISVQDEKRIHNTFSLVQYGGGMLNAVDAFANTPFHTATLANNVLAMRLLLCGTEGKGLKNRKGERGDTPLHMACRMGHREAAEDLINTGVDFKIRNDDGLTALELDRPPRLGVGLAKLIRKRYGYTTSSGFGSSDSDESGAEESGSDESGSGESDA
ncbi:hypothetical protein CGLO_08036 [Colletotrichum gloeosporioides Cg-14]|uniref:Uncharacterized protein n=1 Tax=Colletotrichum gloeosporioides (strain Cg-14) TaxID=1237896 RepID=T0K9X0_COLGC|nr:hypothetical protein CGLO_08036 [Colletotrichum gloeosporioides Cg-14]